MLTTPHAVVGGALGSALGSPFLVVPAAIASHFVLDMVPHWQETLAPYEPSWKTWVRVPIDLVLAFALVSALAHWAGGQAGNVWLGAVMGNLPDTDVATIIWPRWRAGWLARYWDWHCRIQRETASWWGLAPQLAVIAVGLVVGRAS